jgi:hypothetical protein
VVVSNFAVLFALVFVDTIFIADTVLDGFLAIELTAVDWTTVVLFSVMGIG